MTNDNFYFDILQETAKNLVDNIAPNESDLFEEYLKAFRQNPRSTSYQDDEELAFDGGEILATLTPALLVITQTTINYIVAEIIETSKDESIEAIKKKIKLLFQPTANSSNTTFNKDQLKKIKQVALKQAIKTGISKKKAEQIANALISSLALLK